MRVVVKQAKVLALGGLVSSMLLYAGAMMDYSVLISTAGLIMAFVNILVLVSEEK